MEIRCKAIIFDSDGVLVDSHQQVTVAWRQLCQEFSVDFAALADTAGRRPRDILDGHLVGRALERAVTRHEAIEVSLADYTRPVPGAPRLLRALRKFTWAIVTSASRPLALARWNAAGLPVPAISVTADDVLQGKPHSDGYLLAAERLGVHPRDALVFEDSVAGVQAACAAGCTVVGVGTAALGGTAATIADLQPVSVRAISRQRSGAGRLLVVRLRH